MFDRERYLKAILSQSNGGDRLADLMLSAKLMKSSKNHLEQGKTVNVLDGLREHAQEHILLLGKPGSGKSTTLKQLLRKEAHKCLDDSTHPVPVLIELRRLDEKRSFDDAIDKLLADALSKPRPRSIKPEHVTDLLCDNKFLLLIDGLNELPSTTRGFADWRNDFSHTPMIFTSRELGAETYLGIDVRLSMQPLTEDQTKYFIKKRLGDVPALGMLRSLQGRIKELTDTPLLLDMLCDTYQSSGNIPHNQGELFCQFTHDQYEKHKPKDTLTPRHSEFFDFRDEVLQEIAFYMMDAGGDGKDLWLQVRRTDIEKRLEKYFRDKGSSDVPSKVKQWLDDSLNFHLLQRAADKDKVEFSHQLFQEYYAAEWLLRHLNYLSDDQLCSYFLNPIKWTESIFMLMDLVNIQRLAERIVRLALGVDTVLAAKLSSKGKDEYQRSLFDIFYSRIKKENQDFYLELLAINGTEYSVKEIISVLEKETVTDHTWRICFDAIIGVRCELSYNYLICCLYEDCKQLSAESDWFMGSVVKDVMIALWRLEKIDDIIDMFLTPHILERLSHNSLSWIKQESVSNIHLEFIFQIINVRDINNECFNCFQVEAIKALGNFSADKVVDKLIELLYSDKSSIQIMAAIMLGVSSSNKALGSLLDVVYHSKREFKYKKNRVMGVRSGCRCMLDTDMLHEAAKSLRIISPDMAEKEIINYLNNSNDIYEQNAYVIALGFIGGQKSLSCLIDLNKSRKYFCDSLLHQEPGGQWGVANNSVNKVSIQVIDKNKARVKRHDSIRWYRRGTISENRYDIMIDAIELIAQRIGRGSIPFLINVARQSRVGGESCVIGYSDIIRIVGSILNPGVDNSYFFLSGYQKSVEIDRLVNLTGAVPLLLSRKECEEVILSLLQSVPLSSLFSVIDYNKREHSTRGKASSIYGMASQISFLLLHRKNWVSGNPAGLEFIEELRDLLNESLVNGSRCEEVVKYAFLKLEDTSLRNNSVVKDTALNLLDGFSSIDDWPRFIEWMSTDDGAKYNTLKRRSKLQNRHGYYSYEWFEKTKAISKYSPIQHRNGMLAGDAPNNGYEGKCQTELCPLILTEGKTDWKHLEFALSKLQTQGMFTSLEVAFSKFLGSMGAPELMKHCEDALARTPQNRLHIGIFDRDREDINRRFKIDSQREKDFLNRGNNVYILRIPKITKTQDDIAIENYYSETDLARSDSSGRKLRRSGYKVIDSGSSTDLTKENFAELIKNEEEGFKGIGVSNFAKIFELIETIIAEAKKPR